MERPTKIVLATHNEGKLKEISAVLSDWTISSLKEFPEFCLSEETGNSYLENARAKAHEVAKYTGEWALADDSGLEVEALQGRPGIYSARYAGIGATDQKNIQKLLKELQGVKIDQRNAAFRCVLVLAHSNGREIVAEGELKGWISQEPRGDRGFGYDPIFLLAPNGPALAEIFPGEKNQISHRGKALRRLKENLL